MTTDWASLTKIPLLSPKMSDEELRPWQKVIYRLSSPQNAPEGEFGQLIQGHRWLVLAEFARQEWDSKFYRGQTSRVTTPEIKLEGTFWRQTLHLIEKVFSLEPAYEHPAVWFGKIFNEGALGITYPQMNPGTKTQAFEFMQHQNKLLLTKELDAVALFQGEATRALLERAIRIAERADRFRVETYTPFVKSRMSLTAYCEKTCDLLTRLPGGKVSSSVQGRKKTAQKRPEKKVTSETPSRQGFQKKKPF